jgi:hypothetical protein
MAAVLSLAPTPCKPASFVCLARNRYCETLGSYRDCPGRLSGVEPRFFYRGSFDRIVCTEPLAFAADAVIYLWDFNGFQMAWVGFAAARCGESGGADSGSGCDGGLAGLSESAS